MGACFADLVTAVGRRGVVLVIVGSGVLRIGESDSGNCAGVGYIPCVCTAVRSSQVCGRPEAVNGSGNCGRSLSGCC